MAGISMRRLGTLAVAVAFALVATGCTAFVNFTGTKEVTGDESDGPFVVRIECEDGTPSQEELEFDGEGTQESSQFAVQADEEGEATCTITETEQAGAANVIYECGAVVVQEANGVAGAGIESGGGPGMSLARGVGPPADAECIEEAEGLRVEIRFSGIFEDAIVSVEFTVINEFETPTTTTTTAPPAADAGEVTFTG